jgi:hypothetical protein
MTAMEASEARRLVERVAANIESMMRGQHAQVRKLFTPDPPRSDLTAHASRAARGYGS